MSLPLTPIISAAGTNNTYLSFESIEATYQNNYRTHMEGEGWRPIRQIGLFLLAGSVSLKFMANEGVESVMCSDRGT